MAGTAHVTSAVKYGVANVLRNVASVFLLPIYARVLSQSDFGVLEIITVINVLVSNVFGLQIGEAVFRLLPSAENASKQQQIIVSAIGLAFLSNLVALSGLSLLAPQISIFLLHDAALTSLVVINALQIVFDGCVAIPLTQMRANGDSSRFLRISIIRVIAQISFSLIALFWFKAGLVGLVWANVLMTFLSAVCALPYSVWGVRVGASWSLMRSMISIGAPLSFSSLPNGVAASADRFFLSRFASISELGTYSMASRLCQMLLTIIYVPFSQVWDGKKYQAWRDPSGSLVSNVFVLMNFVLIGFGLSIAIFSPEFLFYVMAGRFGHAADIVPLMTATVILGANSDFIRVCFVSANHTRLVLFLSLPMLGLVVPVLFVLTPRFGGVGAALAMSICAFVRLVVELKLASRLRPISLPWIRVGKMVFCSALLYAISTYCATLTLGVALFLFKGLCLLAFPALCVALRLVNRADQTILKSFVPIRIFKGGESS
jgi:O-antigen/teichoic acid export membrane protein